MTGPFQKGMAEDLFTLNDDAFRDPQEVVGHWPDGGKIDPRTLEYQAGGRWWEILATLKVVLLVSREYEHLLMGISLDDDSRPDISYIRIPHPSGLAVNPAGSVIHAASTRNPNQIFDFQPVASLRARRDMAPGGLTDRPLIPVRSRIFPGSLYLHDLVFIGDQLYANSVGQNAIVRIDDTGATVRAWWPRCIESATGPVFGQNHIQLNSIAAGRDLDRSFFSASTEEVTELRPGAPDFPVDRRGVVFSGETREPIVRGLTRPHSARLWQDRLWVNNSGYGEIGYVEQETFRCVGKTLGWTRGLCFRNDYAFIGTSKVLPRFKNYAPGLRMEKSVCGICILNLCTGEIEGDFIWPNGNQIFSVEMVDRRITTGFPFRNEGPLRQDDRKRLFYAFNLPESGDE